MKNATSTLMMSAAAAVQIEKTIKLIDSFLFINTMRFYSALLVDTFGKLHYANNVKIFKEPLSSIKRNVLFDKISFLFSFFFV